MFIQRLPIFYAAPEELRPFRNGGDWIRSFRQEAPESGVMPAELLARAVAVVANATAELPNLLRELLARHAAEILVHVVTGFGLLFAE